MKNIECDHLLSSNHNKPCLNGWCRLGSLTFKAPDNVKYPSMDLAFAAGRAGGTMTGVLSAANEKAVEMFINERYALFSFSLGPIIILVIFFHT